MEFSQPYLLFGALLLPAAWARPALDAEPAAQTSAVTTSVVGSNTAHIATAPRKRQDAGPVEGAAGPDQLVYEPQTDKSHFEVGNLVAAEMNTLIDSEKCKASKEECAGPVQEALDRLASGGNHYERKDVDGKFEARQASVLVIPVAIFAYLLNKLANEPEPTKLEITSDNGDPIADHKPVAVDIPITEFDPSGSETVTTTTSSAIRDRWVLIQTSVANDAKACTSLSSAIAAIATPETVKADLSPFDLGTPLPGYFKVALSPDKDAEVRKRGMNNGKHNTARNKRRRSNAEPIARSVAVKETTPWTNNLVKRGSRDVGTGFPYHSFASWAPEMQGPPSKYAYEDKEGEGYPYYMIDTGFDLSSPEFNDVRDH